MELRHLAHFVAVAEERNFTRAAARLHLVQSAVSVSIRALERELGEQLFDRTTHQVEPTDAGRALLTEARRTLQAADAARDAVAAVRGGVRGTLRVGIMHSLALIDLAGILTRYQRAFPDVQVLPRPELEGTVGLARSVADGSLDLAFAAIKPGSRTDITITPMASEPLLVACPPGHPLGRRRVITPADLAGERLVDFPAGWGTRTAMDAMFAATGVDRQVTLEVGDIATVVELVRAGYGFTYLARSLVRDRRRITLRPARPAATFDVSLVTPADRAPTRAAAEFAAIALAAV